MVSVVFVKILKIFLKIIFKKLFFSTFIDSID